MKSYQTTFTNWINLLKLEENDNHLFSLSIKNQVKPAGVQGRIIRRIVEKRQAKEKHRKRKIMVPNKLELIYLPKDLENQQKDYIFASEINN